jgi:hypothetical protein
MSEHMAVQNVITRYCDAVTRRDWAALADLFAPGATWDVIGHVTFHFAGADIVPGIRGIVESTGRLVQINTPALIEIDGDRATARSTIYELGTNKENTSRFEEPGLYEDVLVKKDGTWRFASRRFTILHFQMNPIPAA